MPGETITRNFAIENIPAEATTFHAVRCEQDGSLPADSGGMWAIDILNTPMLTNNAGFVEVVLPSTQYNSFDVFAGTIYWKVYYSDSELNDYGTTIISLTIPLYASIEAGEMQGTVEASGALSWALTTEGIADDTTLLVTDCLQNGGTDSVIGSDLDHPSYHDSISTVIVTNNTATLTVPLSSTQANLDVYAGQTKYLKIAYLNADDVMAKEIVSVVFPPAEEPEQSE